jgi:hypothetical protein
MTPSGVLAGKAPARDSPRHEHPDDEPDGQQHLPQPGEVEVLEALQPVPVRRGVGEHAMHAEVRADERAGHDDGERAEQGERELVLIARLAPGDHRRREDPRGDERRPHSRARAGRSRPPMRSTRGTP